MAIPNIYLCVNKNIYCMKQFSIVTFLYVYCLMAFLFMKYLFQILTFVLFMAMLHILLCVAIKHSDFTLFFCTDDSQGKKQSLNDEEKFKGGY